VPDVQLLVQHSVGELQPAPTAAQNAASAHCCVDEEQTPEQQAVLARSQASPDATQMDPGPEGVTFGPTEATVPP
jgi:hypothetical protein